MDRFGDAERLFPRAVRAVLFMILHSWWFFGIIGL